MKPGRRIVPQSLSAGGGTPSKEASTSSPADGAAPTTPAPATPATSSEAARQPQQPREQPQAVARSARTAFRAPAAQPALPISAAEQLRQLEEQQVADVAAELQRLEVSFSSSAQDGLFAGIKLDLKPATLKCLSSTRLEAPAVDELEGLEGEGGYPKGLHGVLLCTSHRVCLSRQPLLGRPSLLVRATCDVEKGSVCGCLAGRLTEAPEDIEQDLRPYQIVITRDEINARFKYKGPDLLLDMAESANEFRFLPDTVLRPQEGNVELSMWLVQDAKHGLTLPLVAVVADRDLRKGEELVALSCRDTATRVRAAAEAARQAAARAAEELEKIKKKGVSPSKVDTDKVKRAEKEAEQAEAAADEAAEVEADQLPGKAVEQLLPSGWRQHTLDVFFQRHAELAAKLAGGKAKDSKPQQLKAALAAALERYYGGSTVNATEEEQDTKGGYSGKGSATKQAVSSSKPNVSGSDGSSDSGSDNGKSGGSHAEASALRELQAALEASLLAHPPPLSTQQLGTLLTLKASKQFHPFDGFERPLQQRSDFGSLKCETQKQLDSLDGEPKELPVGCRDQLDSSACFPGIHVCEVAARLHRVRLLTPPNFRALSMHAPAKGNQLQQGACACIYVGQACERGEEQNPDSAYLFDISASEIAAASGAGYSGPSLVVDAATHRNEAAFANCVFGSGCEHNLKPQAVWDPKGNRPHMALVYTAEQAAQPGEELLLDYGFETYWTVQVAKARQAHEEYAVLAGEVILALRQALKGSGASEQELSDCLQPVDLAKDHQQYVRVEAA